MNSFQVITSFSSYRGIHEKGSEDVASAVCYTIYTLYLSSANKQLRRHLPNPLREFSCLIIKNFNLINCIKGEKPQTDRKAQEN